MKFALNLNNYKWQRTVNCAYTGFVVDLVDGIGDNRLEPSETDEFDRVWGDYTLGIIEKALKPLTVGQHNNLTEWGRQITQRYPILDVDLPAHTYNLQCVAPLATFWNTWAADKNNAKEPPSCSPCRVRHGSGSTSSAVAQSRTATQNAPTCAIIYE